MYKEVASSKTKTNSRLECKNQYPIYYHNGGKMAIIDTLFMTKTAENHTLWGRTYLYSPYKGVPPPLVFRYHFETFQFLKSRSLFSQLITHVILCVNRLCAFCHKSRPACVARDFSDHILKCFGLRQNQQLQKSQ